MFARAAQGDDRETKGFGAAAAGYRKMVNGASLTTNYDAFISTSI
jgi:hypothetical protein